MRIPARFHLALAMMMKRTMILLVLLCASKVLSVDGGKLEANWSSRVSEEAEEVAATECSGHGRAYLDGLVLNGNHHPICECNPCYSGSDCSIFLSDCDADAASGEPLFLEPFWMWKAASSGILVSGWHRMGYYYSDGSYISQLLQSHIHKLHEIVGNAVTKGKFIIFGVGSTQLLNAAVHALSSDSSLVTPAKVVTTAPHYMLYRSQTEIFNSVNYRYEGDTSLWQNKTRDESMRFIEFVTSPNNPDGNLNKAVLDGPNVETIHDHAYYWPHFTAIPAPADEDLMLFSISKLTGHCGTRFGWAVIKDEGVYKKMLEYVTYNTMGASRDAQLRVLKLIDVIIERNGTDIFRFSSTIMTQRWMRIEQIMSKSKRFSLQKLAPLYCSYFKRVRDPSPAYAWLKCEREEDKNCNEIFKAAKIKGREGSYYGADNHYMRLSVIRSQDEFDMLINHLTKLVAADEGHQNM